MKIYQAKQGSLLISTDPALLQHKVIYEFLAQAYWAADRPVEVIDRSLAGSLCFGVYLADRQVGFSRVVSDYATFAWLCDVFIHADFRGQGLGTWMLQVVRSHPDLQNLRRWLLATRDAHGLYRKFSFRELQAPERFMEIVTPYPNEH
jgi:GNAT superfamily N-acetyltransferase